MDGHCFWRGGGGGPGPIHHHPQNQQPSSLDLQLPHQGGGVLITVTVAISIGGGGRVSGRGPFAQKRVLAGVACTGLVYYMRVTCPVPVLSLCPYHLEDVKQVSTQLCHHLSINFNTLNKCLQCLGT